MLHEVKLILGHCLKIHWTTNRLKTLVSYFLSIAKKKNLCANGDRRRNEYEGVGI
jgi:hypothetical protein